MTFDEARDTISGLEDDDNFHELVRMRARLQDRPQAIRLTQEVILYLMRGLPLEEAREFLSEMPRDVEEYVYPKLEFERDTRPSLLELERQLQGTWGVDMPTSARLLAAVGLTVVERLPQGALRSLCARLPEDLQNVFVDKTAQAA